MIEDELREFKKFKNNYTFEQKEIVIINGKEFCDGMPLLDEEGKEIGNCEKWINVGYKYSGDYAKLLSNLFHYKFAFRGKKLNSIDIVSFILSNICLCMLIIFLILSI